MVIKRHSNQWDWFIDDFYLDIRVSVVYYNEFRLLGY